MVGFMNRKALETTLRTGFVTFHSRTRQKLWTKGETSGNRLEVVAAGRTAIVTRCCCASGFWARVRFVITGSRSCFTQKLPLGARRMAAEEEMQR